MGRGISREVIRSSPLDDGVDFIPIRPKSRRWGGATPDNHQNPQNLLGARLGGGFGGFGGFGSTPEPASSCRDSGWCLAYTDRPLPEQPGRRSIGVGGTKR